MNMSEYRLRDKIDLNLNIYGLCLLKKKGIRFCLSAL